MRVPGTQTSGTGVCVDVLIEFEKKPLRFCRPRAIVRCFRFAELPEAFARLERFLGQGLAVAGFLSYEAGLALEEKLRAGAGQGSDFPLLCMGAYSGAQREYPRPPDRAFRLTDLAVNISRPAYEAAIKAIREYIAAGDVYQITYCIKQRFRFSGSAQALYRQLLRQQPVPYPAFIEAQEGTIVSLSPEVFMKKKGASLLTKPMKGTWARGAGFLSDCFAGLRLKYDAKNRAENVMIADLLRNDLGRVGTSVRAPKLFEVRRYATLYQMTSTVTCRVPPAIPPGELFAALFPSGSVTGAPKIRAMQIIRELEREERRIYTGAIGYILPNRDLFFNIPIRTCLLRDGCGEMGIGGGIVWDSTAEGEWQEGMLKSRFLARLAEKSD